MPSLKGTHYYYYYFVPAFPALPCRGFHVLPRRVNFECSFAAGNKQVPFDCAQGRLSTALASLRFGRDDRVLVKN